MAIQLKNSKNIERMNSCGAIISQVHEVLSKLVEPGVSTWELDKVAEEYTLSKGFKPAFKDTKISLDQSVHQLMM